jgi:hypothetical protein
VPVSDDDRRDQEVHARGIFGKSLALQIKTSMQLHLHHEQVAPVLIVHFRVKVERLISHPLFWYLFAYLDQKTMSFADPIFLVNSATMHAHAVPQLRGGIWQFSFQANMGPKGRDMWVPYRVHPADLGNRVLQILSDRQQLSKREPLAMNDLRGSDVLWVGHRHGAPIDSESPR